MAAKKKNRKKNVSTGKKSQNRQNALKNVQKIKQNEQQKTKKPVLNTAENKNNISRAAVEIKKDIPINKKPENITDVNKENVKLDNYITCLLADMPMLDLPSGFNEKLHEKLSAVSREEKGSIPLTAVIAGWVKETWAECLGKAVYGLKKTIEFITSDKTKKIVLNWRVLAPGFAAVVVITVITSGAFNTFNNANRAFVDDTILNTVPKEGFGDIDKVENNDELKTEDSLDIHKEIQNDEPENDEDVLEVSPTMNPSESPMPSASPVPSASPAPSPTPSQTVHQDINEVIPPLPVDTYSAFNMQPENEVSETPKASAQPNVTATPSPTQPPQDMQISRMSVDDGSTGNEKPASGAPASAVTMGSSTSADGSLPEGKVQVWTIKTGDIDGLLSILGLSSRAISVGGKKVVMVTKSELNNITANKEVLLNCTVSPGTFKDITENFEKPGYIRLEFVL